jgi:hypothetical protein
MRTNFHYSWRLMLMTTCGVDFELGNWLSMSGRVSRSPKRKKDVNDLLRTLRYALTTGRTTLRAANKTTAGNISGVR